jgi:hypothetical protein
VLTHAGDLWWRTFNEVGEEYPDVTRDYVHVDAACLYLVTQPERFDVVVTENLFGDIITDLGAAVQGGIGLATSGNLDPTRRAPSMFEPVHGSAPDIVGQGTADPTAAVMSARPCCSTFLGEDRRGREGRACGRRVARERGDDGRAVWDTRRRDRGPSRRVRRLAQPHVPTTRDKERRMPFPTADKIWMDGEFVDWDDAKIHVLTPTLHYGWGVFEGIRAYATGRGPAVFQLRPHIERLLRSAKIYPPLDEIPFTVDEVCDAIVETIRVNGHDGCYIRPVIYLGYGEMGLNPLPSKPRSRSRPGSGAPTSARRRSRRACG